MSDKVVNVEPRKKYYAVYLRGKDRLPLTHVRAESFKVLDDEVAYFGRNEEGKVGVVASFNRDEWIGTVVWYSRRVAS